MGSGRPDDRYSGNGVVALDSMLSNLDALAAETRGALIDRYRV